MTWISKYQTILTESEAMNNAQMVANHLTDWSPESISALCGNMWAESWVNPDMYELGYDWSQDRGYGLVQWTPRSKYWDWAVSRGLNPRDGDSQLERIDYEVDQNIQWISTPNYPETYAEFRTSTKDVEYLTAAFTWNYERPETEAGESSMADRVAFAKRCLNELNFDGSAGGDNSGRQLAELPIDYVDISQGEYGSFTHYEGSGQELAIDFVFPMNAYPLFAPFDIEVMDRRDNYATVIWKNARPVMGADGTPHDNLHIIVIHDDNWKDYNIGDTRKKGEHFGNSGNSTGGSGISTGDHFHFEVMKGHTYQFPPPSSNQLHIYDVFDTKNVTTWVRDGGYDWKESDFIDGDGGADGPDQPGQTEGDIVTLLMSGALNGW